MRGDTLGNKSERYINVAIKCSADEIVRMRARLGGSWLTKASSRALAN